MRSGTSTNSGRTKTAMSTAMPTAAWPLVRAHAANPEITMVTPIRVHSLHRLLQDISLGGLSPSFGLMTFDIQ